MKRNIAENNHFAIIDSNSSLKRSGIQFMRQTGEEPFLLLC